MTDPSPRQSDDEVLLHRLLQTLRSHWMGVLLLPTPNPTHPPAPHSARFTIHPSRVSLVIIAEHIVDVPTSGVLCIPDDSPDTVQLTLKLAPTTDDVLSHAADRFRAYHPAASGRWIIADILCAKLASLVLDSEELPLHPKLPVAAQSAARRHLNANPARLAELCKKLLNIEIDSPLAVGIDELGIDVRTTFSPVRLNLPIPADLAALEALIAAILAQKP